MHEMHNFTSVRESSWEGPATQNANTWMYVDNSATKGQGSTISTIVQELRHIVRQKRAKGILVLFVFNLTSCLVLLLLCNSTQSIALQAYTYTVGFNLTSLLTCLLTLWVEDQKPSPVYTFGYERFEVLAVFASTVLAQLSSMFIIKESFERLILEQPAISIDKLPLSAGIAFLTHVVVLYGCKNTALEHVIDASSSSWLQEHVSDISQSLCSLVPPLTNVLLPRVNPMLLVACAGELALVGTHILVQLRSYYVVDTLVGISIAAMMCATMLPMSMYSGKILLQTTPSHVVGQLDKCLRETLTIDGVLEFRNEHFWTLSFGKMAGSLQVRVRRDADEQLVLSHVVDRLSNLVTVLTVQVFKDEWLVRRNATTSSISSVTTGTHPVTDNHHQVPYSSSSETPLVSVSSHATHSNNVHRHSNTANHVSMASSHTIHPENKIHSVNSNNTYAPRLPASKESAPNLFSSVDASRSSNQSVQYNHYVSPQSQTKNLLLTGTRTFDPDIFYYKPR